MGLRSRAGMTLLEILLTGMMMSVLFLGVTTAYVTVLKFLNTEKTAGGTNTLLALEQISRDINVANDAIVDAGGSEVMLRIDRNFPSTSQTTDDVWVIYRFIGNRLRWKTTAPGVVNPTSVSGANAELIPNLSVDNSSSFVLENPTNPLNLADGTVVQINLNTQEGGRSETFTTSVAAGAMSK